MKSIAQNSRVFNKKALGISFLVLNTKRDTGIWTPSFHMKTEVGKCFQNAHICMRGTECCKKIRDAVHLLIYPIKTKTARRLPSCYDGAGDVT